MIFIKIKICYMRGFYAHFISKLRVYARLLYHK